MMLGRLATVLATATAILGLAASALAGVDGRPPTLGEGAISLIQEAKLFDRPDLLNFDPFHATDTWEGSTDTFSFETMGQTYTTTVAYYTDYGFDCFNDPDPEPDVFMPENFLCVRAGHRRPNGSIYDLSYALAGVYSYGDPGRLSYLEYVGQGIEDALIEGAFGSEVYMSGYLRVETKAGAEVRMEYVAEIPDKLTRKIGKIVLHQKAFIDVGAEIENADGEALSEFASWFETCEFKATIKGVAAASQGPMAPPNKQGRLQEAKSRLKCDRDAVVSMVTKVSDGAFDSANSAQAANIFLQALTQLGSTDRINLKVQDTNGTEIVDRGSEDF